MMIRSMVEVDIPRVFEIEQACFSDPWTLNGFKDSLNEAFLEGYYDALDEIELY